MPVGVSFYTFQELSYTVEVYRGRLNAVKNYLDFAVYVSFFPQLVRRADRARDRGSCRRSSHRAA
jgi:D-alanyl-lipoteichoic acid acyltransferase DltB (MBOAT superfamily)